MGKVDVSDCVRAEVRANTLLDGLEDRMLYVAQQGAQDERTNHAYRNRTGNLQRSTKGQRDAKARGEARVRLDMGMPYASFVNNMGLSTIDQVGRETQAGIEDVIRRIGESIEDV